MYPYIGQVDDVNFSGILNLSGHHLFRPICWPAMVAAVMIAHALLDRRFSFWSDATWYNDGHLQDYQRPSRKGRSIEQQCIVPSSFLLISCLCWTGRRCSWLSLVDTWTYVLERFCRARSFRVTHVFNVLAVSASPTVSSRCRSHRRRFVVAPALAGVAVAAVGCLVLEQSALTRTRR